MSMEYYELDSSHYVSAPLLFWDGMLKMLNQSLLVGSQSLFVGNQSFLVSSQSIFMSTDYFFSYALLIYKDNKIP
ncbi:19045_t:CDS:2 [Funneliformis geosporum]|uniref:19045_t:CDS:1 n=1 Tax=Funneliformis geosporum TaxID=1117311 RepID=A0A9W4X2J2_9GLOM|nr:19045_t:CDS:2 [Funneliformis geosporum]